MGQQTERDDANAPRKTRRGYNPEQFLAFFIRL